MVTREQDYRDALDWADEIEAVNISRANLLRRLVSYRYTPSPGGLVK